MACSVDRAGLAGVWVPDHLLNVSRPHAGVLDCWTILAAVAGACPGLRIGPLVLTTPFRHGPLLARQSATLDAVCGGRLRLGLGAGGFTYEEAARQYGYPLLAARERRIHCRETIECLRAMWTEDPANVEGRFLHVRGARVFPRPARPIPVVLAARKPGMLQLAAELADEWNCPLPQELAELMPSLWRRAEAIGRRPDSIRVSVFSMLVAGEDATQADAALERAGDAAQVFGDIRAHHAFGTPAQIVERLARLAAAGVSEVTFDVRGIPIDEAADMLAREILPFVEDRAS